MNSIDTCIRKLFLVALCLIMPVGVVGMQEMPEWAEHMAEEGLTTCLAGIAVAHVIPRSYVAMSMGVACALPVMYAMGKKISHEDMMVKLREVASKTKTGVELLLSSAHGGLQDQMETPFFEKAVKLGLVEVVEQMILASSDCKTKWKSNVVFDAVQCDSSAQMVALLVKHGIKLQNQEWAFYEAVKKGDPRTVQLFLDAGIALDRRAFKSRDWTVVDVAAYYGHLGVTELLLSKGACPNPSIVPHVTNAVILYVLKKHEIFRGKEDESAQLGMCRGWESLQSRNYRDRGGVGIKRRELEE